jgi:DNA (cytosine-5)-methyltransferase 1
MVLRVFEMFAGYGGASFALKKAEIEFNTIGFSEIDKNAIKVFELNHPNIKNYGDCSKINVNELPDFDLLTAGFPCQPFSINTKHSSRGENHKSYNLFEDIIRIVNSKKPRYILLENVRGILGLKSRPAFNRIVSGLGNLGYDVKVLEANSKDYGIPQNRERVYFICKLGRWENYKEPEKEELRINIKDILEDGVKRREPSIKKYKLKKKENIEKFGEVTRFEAILKNPVSKRNSNIKYEILDAPSNTVSRQQDRIYNTDYAPCLTATGRDYLFEVDNEIINLTPKECFRLMGFLNDEIKLDGINDNQRYKLAGNGWDINLVSKILKQMLSEDDNPNREISISILKDSNLEIKPSIKEKKEEILNIIKGKLNPKEFWICNLMINDL